MIKFADDTAYGSEVDRLAQYSKENNLTLNAYNQGAGDGRREMQDPITINWSAGEMLDIIELLGGHIIKDLTWEEHTNVYFTLGG